MNNTIFNLMFTIVPILVACIFIFTIAMLFSPKLKSKFMSKQIKTLKYMMEDSEGILTDLSKTAINVKKNILDENEDTLKDLASKEAEIESIGIERKASALKKGFFSNLMYCKNCGKQIDDDSKFCKNCGTKQ